MIEKLSQIIVILNDQIEEISTNAEHIFQKMGNMSKII